MNETLINEPVKVWVKFDGGLSPIAINWRKRLIRFNKVIFTSSKMVGETKLLTLICESNAALFELEYNSENYLWKLRKIIPAD